MFTGTQAARRQRGPDKDRIQTAQSTAGTPERTGGKPGALWELPQSA